MALLKEFLTAENIYLFGLNISTFILTAIIILLLICLTLKLKKKPIVSVLIKVTFLSLAIITLIFAFLNALTGEFLFSQTENMKLYMLIAAVTLFIHIVDSLKELFKNGSGNR